MSFDILCPTCGSTIHGHVNPNEDQSGETPGQVFVVDGVSAATAVQATDAAVAHAEATGVDLTQVEGTGADGTITKPDVVAAANDPEHPANPASGDPGDETAVTA